MTPIRHALVPGVFFSQLMGDFRTRLECNWLLDVIATRCQIGACKRANKKDERFNDMQMWRLRKLYDGEQAVDDDGNEIEAMAVVEACADFDNGKAIDCHDKQYIPFTDWDFEKNGEPKFFAGLAEIDGKIGRYIYLPEEY